MKNSIPLVLCSMLLTLFTISCNDASEEVVSVEPGTKLSEIDLLEKEMGVSLFKAEMVLTDDANTNTVTLQIASRNAEELNHYLTNNDFSIEPVQSIQPLQYLADRTPVTQDQESSLDNSKRIYSEVIDQNLSPGVMSYSIHVKQKMSKAGRELANGYTYQLSVISGEWPTYFSLYSTANVGVSFKIRPIYRDPWDIAEICNEFTDYCDFYHTNSYHNLYTVEGNYKAQALVDYNNISDFSYSFL